LFKIYVFHTKLCYIFHLNLISRKRVPFNIIMFMQRVVLLKDIFEELTNRYSSCLVFYYFTCNSTVLTSAGIIFISGKNNLVTKLLNLSLVRI